MAKSYRLLRAILNTAVDDGRIKRNPCRIKGADRENPPERPVASVQQLFLLADTIGPTYRAFVLTAALASLRWGELVALRRRDIDLESGLIFVRRSMVERGGSLEIALPKNNRGRTVALPAVLVEELRGHLEGVPTDPDAPSSSGNGAACHGAGTGGRTSGGRKRWRRQACPTGSTSMTSGIPVTIWPLRRVPRPGS